MVLTWSAPRPAPSNSAPSLPAPSPPFLDTIEGETALFRALIYHRPVGIDRYWAMIGVELALREGSGSEWERAPMGELWRKLGEMYNLGMLGEMHEAVRTVLSVHVLESRADKGRDA